MHQSSPGLPIILHTPRQPTFCRVFGYFFILFFSLFPRRFLAAMSDLKLRLMLEELLSSSAAGWH